MTFKKLFLILTPYAWLFVFFLVPFFYILKISFSEEALSIPPHSGIFFLENNHILSIKLNLSNYINIFKDWFLGSVFLTSIRIAFISTLGTLLIGFPIAFAISKTSGHLRFLLMMLVLLPFGTSFLVRIYAWMGILGDAGFINTLLLYTGLIKTPIKMLHTDFAIIIGMIYCYLPFMILPIYSVLQKIDPSIIEAAFDLGSKPRRTFTNIILPLSAPGILAGCILVFIPAVGEFVIPELLGGTDALMIGRVLWSEFFINRDWPLACSLAILMLVIFVTPIALFQNLRKDPST